ncbi:MAG: SDR family oxidoreductase [Planctomycetes bacterium]|nr:SDR family oxidoreductase [Planctomycetota bacterium]
MKPRAMVVGGSQRVGRAVALELARAGFDLVVTYRRDFQGAAQTRTLALELGAESALLRMDLDDAEGALAAAHSVAAGALDALILSAAMWERDSEDADGLEQAARLMRVNARTPTQLARALAPALERSSLTGGASVMAFGDIHTHVHPIKGYGRYLASKAALENEFRGLALELAPKIRVNVIVAGVIAWPDSMDDSQRALYLERVPLGRAGTPKDAAALVRFVTLEAPFMTGAAITLDGGRSLR